MKGRDLWFVVGRGIMHDFVDDCKESDGWMDELFVSLSAGLIFRPRLELR